MAQTRLMSEVFLHIIHTINPADLSPKSIGAELMKIASEKHIERHPKYAE